jgi:hypothetical protein
LGAATVDISASQKHGVRFCTSLDFLPPQFFEASETYARFPKEVIVNPIKSSASFMTLVAFLGMFACASKPVEPQTSQSANGSQPSAPLGDAKLQSGPPDGDQGHRGPPEEAFTACSGKSEGDACTVTHHNETQAGTCRKGPPNGNDQRLACMPKDGPGNHHGPGPGAPN